MVRMYRTDMETNKLEEVRNFEKGTWVNMINPTEQEIKKVCDNLKIKEDFIRYPLDIEEKARIDIEDEDDTILFILDVPIIEKEHGNNMYTTMPVGMIVVRDDYFITCALRQTSLIKTFENGNMRNFATYKKSRFILQMMYNNSADFLKYLTRINKEVENAEGVLKTSMKNKELLELLALEKALVYFTTSLRSNEAVMERTLKIKSIKLYEEDEDILEDAIIENKQALEMSKIYNNILTTTMDAYASIISNNLNGVMKFLTSITIILAIPTMIASYWGMNVRVPLQDNPCGFIVVVTLSIVLGIVAMFWLKKRNMLN